MLKSSSVSVAKDRLKTLITSDRVKCAPEEYENIRRDLYRSLSRYMELTEDNFSIEICRTYILIQFAGDKT